MTATPKPLRLALAALALAAVALTGCGKWADELFCGPGGCGFSDSEWARLASLANPGDPPPDLSNEFRDNPFIVTLGKEFYFDPAFSGNATQLDAIRRESPAARAPKGQPIGIACVTCHDLEHGGADTSSSPGHVSVGAGWTDVNALSVLNSAYRQVVFWNGRADSLWALNGLVAESLTTMNGNRLNTAHVIATRYAREYERVFGIGSIDAALIAALPANGKPGGKSGCQTGEDAAGEPFQDAWDCLYDPSGTLRPMLNRILVNWSKAIAAYEYKLISRNSPFDKFVTEGRDSTRLSAAAKRGALLFVGKGACVDCHAGPQLTDELFHNIGVPQTGTAVPRTTDCPKGNAACDCSPDSAGPCAPWGAWDGLKKLRGKPEPEKTDPTNIWLRTDTKTNWSDDTDDLSRQMYVDLPTADDFDRLKGAWRTPSLRNVALTAPYMHDGRYASLKDVIWHYNNGAATAGPEQVGVTAPQIKPLLLTESEQDDLIAFLETLTGEPLSDDLRQPPALPPGGGPGTGGSGSPPSGAGGMGGGTGGSASSPTGAAGAGGPAPLPRPVTCAPTAPSSPLVTDFNSSGDMNPVIFMSPSGIAGRTFFYGPPGVPVTWPIIRPGPNGSPALLFATRAAPPPVAGWYGFGLTFDNCVDGRAFYGVRFALENPMGPTCPVEVAVTSRQNVSLAEDPRGSCPVAGTCPPRFVAVPQVGTVTAPFPPMSGSFEPGALIGVQWRVPASCSATFTVDDIVFAGP